ncbi:MAG: hypothetical protein ACHQRO_03485 [Vicinamibacteria bacterium]|jgi:hypothetical protein
MTRDRIIAIVSVVLGGMLALSAFSRAGAARWAYLILGLVVVAWGVASLAGKKP